MTVLYSATIDPIVARPVSFIRQHSTVQPDFDIQTIEPGHPDLPVSRISRYEIFWMKQSGTSLHVDGQDYPLMPHQLFCIAPGHWRRLSMPAPTHGYYISFAPDFLLTGNNCADSYEDNFAQLQILDASGYLQAEVQMLIHKMIRENNHSFHRKTELLKGLVQILMIHFGRQGQHTPAAHTDTRETSLIRQFVQLVRTHFMEKKMVSDYADILCVTANHLNRTVKKLTGQTASYHIQQQVIREAKRMAIYSETSMKEIAYSLGFDNLAHFSKFFKNNSGSSFSNYRKNATMG